MPDADHVVSVTSEELETVLRPGKRDASGDGGVFADSDEFRAKLINNRLGFQIPDLDAR